MMIQSFVFVVAMDTINDKKKYEKVNEVISSPKALVSLVVCLQFIFRRKEPLEHRSCKVERSLSAATKGQCLKSHISLVFLQQRLDTHLCNSKFSTVYSDKYCFNDTDVFRAN